MSIFFNRCCRRHFNSALERAMATDTTDKNITFSLSQYDEFLTTLDTALKEATDKNGYILHTINAMGDPNKQIQAVEEARKNGDKVIIVNLVNGDEAPEILNAAGNMKVVFVNIPPSDVNILNENAIYVGSNELTSGKLQGEWLANYFKSIGKTDIQYILLEGDPRQPATEYRTKSALQALADGGIKATEAAPPIIANYDRNIAYNKILPLLRSGVKFDAAIANNDAMALGAIEAMEQLGMDPSQTPVVGIDGTIDGLRAVDSGEMAMTVYQNAEEQGNTAVIAAINLLERKPIAESTAYKVSLDSPYVIWIPFEAVTKNNISDYL